MGKAPKPLKKQTILSVSQLSKNFVCFNIVPKSWVISCVYVCACTRVCLLLGNVQNEVSGCEALKVL